MKALRSISFICLMIAGCASINKGDSALNTNKDWDANSCSTERQKSDGHSAKIVFANTSFEVLQQSINARFKALKYDVLDKIPSLPQDIEPKFACSNSSEGPNLETVSLAIYDGYASVRRTARNARIAPAYYKISEAK